MKKIILIIVLCSMFIISCNKKQESINSNIKEGEIMKIYVKVKDRILSATLDDNSSSKALIEKLNEQDITINMHDYGNFEKVGELEFSLPRNDKQITTKPGDIILYQGNQITIYYDKNSWNFTKLGHIDNITQSELKNILGDGNITITLSINN